VKSLNENVKVYTLKQKVQKSKTVKTILKNTEVKANEFI